MAGILSGPSPVRAESLDSETLTLDFGHHVTSTVNAWARMPECDEFVGTRRSKHTTVAYKGAIFFFGGDNGKSMLNDLIRYDVKEKSWGRALTISTPPPSRYHHTASLYNGSMFIFGGYTGDIHSNSNLTNKNDLHEYKFATGQWVEWHPQGRCPVARAAHGAAVFDDKLWIFAGYDGHARLNDMWTLSLSAGHIDRQWQQVDQDGHIPPTRCNFALTVHEDNMYVFSGQSGAHITNSLFKFNFTTHVWTKVSTNNIVRASHPPPKKRYGHSMVTFNNCIYVFGGATGQLLPNDLYCFDLQKRMWSIVSPAESSETPAGRLLHGTAVVDDAMYIFGGTVDHNVRSGEMYKFQFSTHPKCTLHEDFARLLQNSHFYDVAFVIGESQTEVHAHASIVAARSQVLREKLLEVDNCQSTSLKLILLPNTTIQATKFLLSYIYSDAIEPAQNGEEPNGISVILSVIDVYHLSCQLSMKRLESLCEIYLHEHICRTNVLSALMYSAELNLISIKEYCIETIVSALYMHEIVMSSEFEQLSQSLLVEVIRSRLKRDAQISTASNEQSLKREGQLNASNSEQSLLQAQPNNSHSLKNEMREFMQSKGRPFCDITLILQGERIPAHKAVLAARCHYFEAMFRNFPPKDNVVNISIGDTVPSRRAFESLLRYIYYGDVTMPTEDSLYLFPAPHFYGFTNNRLQAYCKQNLEMKVSTDNVIQVLETAHNIGAVDMKKQALGLIAPHISRIARTPQFRRLDKDLLLEIIDALAQHDIGGDHSVDIVEDEISDISA